MSAERRDDGVELVLAQLSRDDLGKAERGRLLARLAGLLARRGARPATLLTGAGRWLADLVVEVAPHVSVRNLATLRAHYPGRSGDDLAHDLVASASRATAAVGFAGGAVTAAEWLAPPSLLSVPLEVAAETLAVVAVELKLVAELHQVYDVIVPGTPAERGSSYVAAWARRRGVDVGKPGGVAGALGSAARRELRTRVARRFGRNVSTVLPMLAGAAAGAELNRRDTRALGDAMIADLRRRH